MMIRLAVREDLPKALDLIREFQQESLFLFGFVVSEGHIQNIVEQFLASSFVIEESGKILGVLALHVVEAPLSGEKVAEEIIWYVSKENRLHGVKLFRYVESWCVSQGIRKIVMTHMVNERADQLAAFYRHCGYVPLEIKYLKQLGV